MTELETAVDFVRVFAEAVVMAVKSGERLDERRELARYCDEVGIEATPARLDLARDLVLVLREHFWKADEADSFGSDDIGAVPLRILAEGLERHGWRREFLERGVGE